MTLWSSTLEKSLSFRINLFAHQFYPPQSSHWMQFSLLISNKSLCTPSSCGRDGWPGTGVGMPVPHCTDLQRAVPMARQVSVHVTTVSSFPRPLSLYICFHEPSHVQNSCSKWSLWVLKWHRDQGKDHMRSNVQAAAATFSNLDWKTKR